MNKKNTLLIVILVVIVLCVFLPIGSYNSLVSLQTTVENQTAEIDNQLQRRMDLIPNLVETVKGYAAHETKVFDSVNAARESMMSAETMQEKANANENMTSALGRLVAVAEAYPELKSDTVYIGLMDELAGTENRISYARNEYNASVKSYNLAIKRFPSSIFASMFGFEKAEFFKAAEEAKQVPTVKFD